jgi:carbon-monoxide dehydrogenase large subunit
MRLEDQRLLTGRGRFVDDLPFDGVVHACVVRSPYAHARIRSIHVDDARSTEGVLAVYTGTDLLRDGLGPLPCIAPVDFRDGSPMQAPERHALAVDEVRFVGDSVAVVVAESADIARDAANLVDVDYEELDACVDLRQSDTRCFDWERGDAEAVEAAFAGAEHVCTLEAVNNRIVVSPIETRGAVGEYHADNESYTLHTQTQGVHKVRDIIADSVLGIPRERLRVITNDVGGSFGMKIFVYPEQVLVLYAARDLGRPVKWVGDRGDAFLTDAHGRDHVGRAELALDAEGRFLAIRAHVRANLGAYLSSVAPLIPTDALARVFGHVYDVPALYLLVEGMFTNTAPVDAYRGAGKPEIVTLTERLIDMAARQTGIDRVELRRRNLVPASAMPYTTCLGRTIDTGDFVGVMDEALVQSDWQGFEARRRESEARGARRGIGLGLYLHATGGSATEVSQVELAADGTVLVRTGTQSAGQGHETGFAQVVAGRLEIPLERVRVIQGDTELIASGGGTGGSSSLPIGATTILRATEDMLVHAGELAGEMLEAAVPDIDYAGGRFTVKGTDLSVGLFDLAPMLTEGQTRSCVGEAAFEGDEGTYPNGAYVCEVSIDGDTGAVRIEAFTTVDDLGNVLNEGLATGQIMGGVVQGIGQALLERTCYDRESGQLITGSFMDYGLPRADDLPSFTGSLAGEPCRANPLGMKGAGEVGTIGAPAAVVNAVVDALGGRDIEMPTTPERVWRLIRDS